MLCCCSLETETNSHLPNLNAIKYGKLTANPKKFCYFPLKCYDLETDIVTNKIYETYVRNVSVIITTTHLKPFRSILNDLQ